LSLTQRLASGARGPVGDGAGAAPGRSRRLAKGHWVALSLGLLAFLVNIAVLRDRRETVRVAVADQEIGMATEVTEDMVRYVDMPADVAASLNLADADDIDAGVFTTDDLQEGMPLPLAETVDELPGDQARSMSIPLGREHAAGGMLSPGDRVDVIMVSDDGEAEFAATNIEVLAVGDEGDGGLGEQAGEFHVVVAVDERQALRIAQAIGGEQIEVIRSTGAPEAQEGASEAGPGSVIRDDTTTTTSDDGDGG
jgi:Flp pilus assembly protein CpaB